MSSNAGLEFALGVVWIGVPVTAYAVCLLANWMDRRDGYQPEAPTTITGLVCAVTIAMVLVTGTTHTLEAAQQGKKPRVTTMDEYQNPMVAFCNSLDPGGYWYDFWDCDEVLGRDAE